MIKKPRYRHIVISFIIGYQAKIFLTRHGYHVEYRDLSSWKKLLRVNKLQSRDSRSNPSIPWHGSNSMIYFRQIWLAEKKLTPC